LSNRTVDIHVLEDNQTRSDALSEEPHSTDCPTNANGRFEAAGKVGYGRLAIDAGLGFDDDVCPGIVAPFDLKGWHTISAHADSEVVLRTERPAEILGFLNCSAREDRANPVTFWLSRNRIGEGASPGDRTRAIKVPAGEFTLEKKKGHKPNAFRLSIFRCFSPHFRPPLRAGYAEQIVRFESQKELEMTQSLKKKKGDSANRSSREEEVM